MEIKYGSLFKLNEHFLVCGDTTDPKIVGKLMGSNKINLVLTDVPYGISYVEGKQDLGVMQDKSKKVIANDQNQSESEYQLFTKKWIDRITPFLAEKNSVYIFNSDKMVFALREGMKQAGLTFSQLIIWLKNTSVIGRKDYLLQHELIAVGWYKTHAFYKSKDKSIITYPKPSKSTLHPTMKPVGLLRRLILNSSRIGDIVYDGFSGSGSIMTACEQTKRRAFMVELDAEYCQVIINRFEKLTGCKAVSV